jgi:hypothetical protein
VILEISIGFKYHSVFSQSMALHWNALGSASSYNAEEGKNTRI